MRDEAYAARVVFVARVVKPLCRRQSCWFHSMLPKKDLMISAAHRPPCCNAASKIENDGAKGKFTAVSYLQQQFWSLGSVGQVSSIAKRRRCSRIA
jgi:hypothetical protein